MNPEEEFARLHDESLWRVGSLAPRAGVHRSSWVGRWAIPLVAGLVVVALVVLGVNSVRSRNLLPPAIDTPSPTFTPTKTPSPTEVPTQAPTPSSTPIAAVPGTKPWTSPPTPVFGGKCSSLFSTAELQQLLAQSKISVEKSNYPVFDLVPSTSVVELNGGIHCAWRSDPDSDGRGVKNPWLRVVALPAAAVPGVMSSTNCALRDNQGCEFTMGAAGYVLSGSINTTVPDDESVALVESMFAKHAQAAGPPPSAWVQRSTDWPASVDCATLAAPGTAAIDHGSYSGAAGSPDVDSIPLVTDLAVGRGNSICSLTSDHEDQKSYTWHIGANILAGGAWLAPDVAALPGAKRVTIAGADRAYAVTLNAGEGPSTLTFVFSGTNAFEFTTYPDGSPGYAAASAIIATLNKLRAK